MWFREIQGSTSGDGLFECEDELRGLGGRALMSGWYPESKLPVADHKVENYSEGHEAVGSHAGINPMSLACLES